MKVGDLVRYRMTRPSARPVSSWRRTALGIVGEVASGNDRRVKWFGRPEAWWYSQKNLELVNENR